jgi:hypothetical protein
MKYSDKLKDPRWQKKRLEIFERDEWTCQICGSKDVTLSVHHFHYVHGFEPWNYKNDSLITLCFECHNEEYELKKENEQILLETLARGKCFSDTTHLLACILATEIGENDLKEFIEALSHSCRRHNIADKIVTVYREWKTARN